MARYPGVIAGVVSLALGAQVVRADDTHYRAIPIGAHAIGLGGAFTGVADDVSAAYFNPAGLALGGTVGIAAGLTINAWERADIEALLQQPDGGANATTRTSRTVPIFIGAALKLGPRNRFGERRYTVGVSVVEPIFSSGGALLKLESLPPELSDSYRITNNDRATWYGLSFSGQLDARQSLGVSLYLSVRRSNHGETGLTVAPGELVPDEPGSLTNATTVANTQSLSFKAFHFALRFGWLRRIKPQLQLGIMVQPPGIPLKQKVNAFAQGFLTDNRDPTTPSLTSAFFIDETFGANLPIPAEIEAGLEYWPAERVMLAFDASFHAPVRSRSRVESASSNRIDGLFYDNDTARRAIGNVAIAGDFFIGKVVSVSTGFFTDLSAAPKIPEDPDRYYSPRIHRLGGTASIGFEVAGVSLAVGSTFIYGRGDATGVVTNLDYLDVDYTRNEAKSRIVYLHITGATRAAEDLGMKAAERIKERQQEKKKKNGEDTRANTKAQDTESKEEAPTR